jgi:hypothetical protein
VGAGRVCREFDARVVPFSQRLDMALFRVRQRRLRIHQFEDASQKLIQDISCKAKANKACR